MFQVRVGLPEDAEQIISLLSAIAAEGRYTAISKPWSVEAQRHHMAALSPRESLHVAIAEDNSLLGYQVLELWAPGIESMAHAGQLGTFVRADARGSGVGRALFRRTLLFAAAQAYAKFVVQVRAGNAGALAFYGRLGFRECGRLARQVRIGDLEEDEVLMESFL